MDSFITAIEIVRACAQARYDYKSLKPECRAFQTTLQEVAFVLGDVKEQFQSHESESRTTSFARPVKLLQNAVQEAEVVLKKCSNKKKLKAALFSKEYLGKLDKAKSDIFEALSILQSYMQANLKKDMTGGHQSTMDELRQVKGHLEDLRAKYARQGHEVAVQVHELLEHRDDRLCERMLELFTKNHIVSDRKDFEEQLAEIQRNERQLLKEKALVDEFVVKAVLNLSLQDASSSSPAPSAAATTNLNVMQRHSFVEEWTCPITLDIMTDPVILVPSGTTLDHQSACKALLIRPNVDPVTGTVYDVPFTFVPNIAIRKQIMEAYGADQYVPYKDKDFEKQYNSFWERRKCASLPVNSPQQNIQQNTNNQQDVEQEADQGDADEQFQLGLKYDLGRGVEQSDAKAVEYYQLAANQGHAQAQCNLG